MIIEPTGPTTRNPEEQFAGGVYLDLIAAPHGAQQRAVVAKVRFLPGARTAWHSHARGQYLHITQGTAIVGDREGNRFEVHAGQTLYTPPGEEHFHAAPEDTFMEHIAILENADDPSTTTTWLEHITDDEYRRR